MLQNTFAIIDRIVKQNIDDIGKSSEIAKFISLFKKGYWIYPGVLKRKFDISITEVYSILVRLESEGILESNYELYCKSCNKTTGELVSVFNEIPNTFYCEMCEEELSGVENALMIFKVIHNE